MKRTPLVRKTSLVWKPTLKSKKPINKTSKRKAAVNYRDRQDKLARIAIVGPLCEVCDRGPAELHHVRTKAARPDLRHVAANHILLCHECHTKWHSHPIAGRNAFRRLRPEDAEVIGLGRELEGSKRGCA